MTQQAKDLSARQRLKNDDRTKRAAEPCGDVGCDCRKEIIASPDLRSGNKIPSRRVRLVEFVISSAPIFRHCGANLSATAAGVPALFPYRWRDEHSSAGACGAKNGCAVVGRSEARSPPLSCGRSSFAGVTDILERDANFSVGDGPSGARVPERSGQQITVTKSGHGVMSFS